MYGMELKFCKLQIEKLKKKKKLSSHQISTRDWSSSWNCFLKKWFSIMALPKQA
jgi:hypothetical protein